MSEWRRYYGQDWPPVPDGAGGYRPITREFAAMLIAKKWKFFKEEQERLNQMVALGMELIPISLDEAKEIQEMGFAKWKQWEFETTEWN